jgi:mycothiol synthase
VNVLVLDELDPAHQSDLGAFLVRCDAADGHPAFPEPQRLAVSRSDMGAAGLRALLAYDGGVLVGSALLTPASDGSTALHVVIDPAHRAGGDVHHGLIQRALAESAGGGPIRLWTMRATEADDEEAGRHSFVPERDLLQMRVRLPLPAAVVAHTRPVATRPFRPGHDDARWLDTNNRAFAGHPEQGAWTLEQLHDRLAAPWVDLDGFRMADDADGDGLIGSCWTKVHRGADPVLGEIYVISVNPDHHGQGWGRALTVAGLRWLAEKGIPVGMLYTDATNQAAAALYHSLGFAVDHVDRSYVRNKDPGH